MADSEQITDEAVLKQIQQEREEEARAVRSGQQPQGAARTTPKAMTPLEEDAVARRINEGMPRGERPPVLDAYPRTKEDQAKAKR